MTKPKKAKAVPYRFIELESEEGKPIYARLQRIVAAHHEDIREARIALVWHLSWKPDVDGRVTLGMCRKVSDLDRELRGDYNAFDFIILLNKKWWTDPLTTHAQRDALLDHECCHAAVSFDQGGEPNVDERGRTVYRLRGHDVEEFAEIIKRHGTYTRNLELTAAALDRVRADSAGYVGIKSTHERLRIAGASLTFETVVSWTEPERRDADVWARLVLELKKRELDADVDPPAHVAAAMVVRRDSQGELQAATAH